MSTHASLQKKQCQSLEEGLSIGRKEAVFAVCLHIDIDINEVMQFGSIITSLWSTTHKKVKSKLKDIKINYLPDT